MKIECNESEGQRLLFEWAAAQKCKYPELACLYHIPNEGKRTPRHGARLKREGLKAGVSDIHLPVARGHYIGLWIELKAPGGIASKAQCDWIELMRSQGHKAEIVYGWKTAQQMILAYLRLPKG